MSCSSEDVEECGVEGTGQRSLSVRREGVCGETLLCWGTFAEMLVIISPFSFSIAGGSRDSSSIEIGVGNRSDIFASFGEVMDSYLDHPSLR